MFSKILVKLIDQSILPAILLIAARVGSIFIIARYFDITFTLGPEGFMYQNYYDYVFVNSYSTLAMVIVLGVGLSVNLIKSLFFHDTHITPYLTARLFSLKMSSLIQTSYDLYSQGTIWLSYLYFITLATGVMVYFGLIYGWVFWICLAFAIVCTVLLFMDIEDGLGAKNKNPDVLDDVVLELEEINVR